MNPGLGNRVGGRGRGLDLKTVSAILGHAKTSITLNLYAHVLEEMQERAVWAAEDLLIERSGVKPVDSGRSEYKTWLGGRDSNPDKQLQRLPSYR